MAFSGGADKQTAFARAMASLIRQARVRQHLTQAQVAARTGGIISKAALANYESGIRSLRIDVFWVIVKALGEDAGALLAAAERGSGLGGGAEGEPITVDIAAMQHGTDPRLESVRRWFVLRVQRNGNRAPVRTVTLDSGAIAALAQLMKVDVAECRAILATAAVPAGGARRADGGVRDDSPDVGPRGTAQAG